MAQVSIFNVFALIAVMAALVVAVSAQEAPAPAPGMDAGAGFSLPVSGAVIGASLLVRSSITAPTDSTVKCQLQKLAYTAPSRPTSYQTYNPNPKRPIHTAHQISKALAVPDVANSHS
ncbi:conserved hypothetical protein [Ricinus communis]|uniref:Uncharacterized protein n=1 Tax=Ricinus communis TaxID=3988 RepID=B9SL73_RICCO|nr:conserved hypothetical protein [Ricinus communis]